MVEPMTDAQLAEIEARADKATPGPWEDAPQMGSSCPAICHPGDTEWQGIAYAWHIGNRQFIASARSDVPDLAAEVRRLRALLAGLAHDDGDLKMTGEYVARRFQELRAELDAAQSEVRRLLAFMAEPEKITMEAEQGKGVLVEVKHWAVKLLAASLSDTLRELGGENFVTMEVASEHEAMVVTIRRKWGKSPEERYMALAAENADLRSQLIRMSDGMLP